MAKAIYYLKTSRAKCNQNPLILSGSSYFTIGGNQGSSLHIHSPAIIESPYASVFKKPDASTWCIIKQSNRESQNIQLSVNGVEVRTSFPYRLEVGDWVRLSTVDKNGEVDILFTNDSSYDVTEMTAETIETTWKPDTNRMVGDDVANGLSQGVNVSCSQCAVFSLVSSFRASCNYCFNKSICRPMDRSLKPTASLVLLNEDVYAKPFTLYRGNFVVSVRGSCKVGKKKAKKLYQEDLEGLYLDITVKGWFVRSMPGVTLNGSPIMLDGTYYPLTTLDNIVFVGKAFRFQFQPDDLSDLISKLKLVNRVVALENDLTLKKIELKSQRKKNGRLLAELKEKRSKN